MSEHHPEVPVAAQAAVSYRQSAQRVLQIEAEAITALIGRIGASFEAACALLAACRGRIVVTGMGKSGHIGSKIAATLASTGTPAFFLHPAEASHGDLGMIVRRDVLLAISNSGETREILDILPIVRREGVPLITLTGRADSTMARSADVNLDVAVAREACPLDLAPTASTTAALAMGDALAVALLEQRGFTAADFARSHPGGRLGRRLLLRVGDLMHRGERVPRVTPAATLGDALLESTRKGLGLTTIVDPAGQLVGLFTDGDLRRALEAPGDVRRDGIAAHMSRHVKTIDAELLAVDALNLMEAHKITALVVVDADGRVEGILHMHDLLAAGVV